MAGICHLNGRDMSLKWQVSGDMYDITGTDGGQYELDLREAG